MQKFVCHEQFVTKIPIVSDSPKNCHNLHQEVDAITENRGRVDLHALESGMSSSNAGQSLELRVWNKNYTREVSFGTSDLKRDRESKMQVSKKLVKLLDDRLRILEEDDENLKGEFMKIMKERSELISEVREYFGGVHCNLHFTNQESGEIFSHGLLAIEPLKNDRTGLLQVLWQESNPSLLTRGQSAQGAVKLN